MFIQTFIEKHDGSPVFVDFEGVRYIFQKNQNGDAVCYVGNQQHQKRLLRMGESSYKEYTGQQNVGHKPQPGSVQQLGPDAQRSDLPPPNSDVVTDVDEEMEDFEAGVEAADSEKPPKWPPHEIAAKIKEFKFLPPDNFKTFVDNNRDQIVNWPDEVKTVLAKKLTKQFPDHDPEIEGFNADDYLGSRAAGNS